MILLKMERRKMAHYGMKYMFIFLVKQSIKETLLCFLIFSILLLFYLLINCSEISSDHPVLCPLHLINNGLISVALQVKSWKACLNLDLIPTCWLSPTLTKLLPLDTLLAMDLAMELYLEADLSLLVVIWPPAWERWCQVMTILTSHDSPASQHSWNIWPALQAFPPGQGCGRAE